MRSKRNQANTYFKNLRYSKFGHGPGCPRFGDGRRRCECEPLQAIPAGQWNTVSPRPQKARGEKYHTHTWIDGVTGIYCVQCGEYKPKTSHPAECKHPERPDYSDLIEKVEGMRWKKRHKWSKEKIDNGRIRGMKSYCVNCSCWEDTGERVCGEPNYNQALDAVLELLKQERGKK